MNKKFIPFTVIGWNKHNPQKRSGNWFKVSHHIFDDPKVADLNAKEFKLYIILLTLCSKSCNQSSLLNSIHCRIECKMRSHTQLFQALRNLERNGLVSLEESRLEERREEKNKRKKQDADASGSADAFVETGNEETTSASLRSGGNAPLRSAEFFTPTGPNAKTKTPKPSFATEIEEIYKNTYPRKEGKTRGLQKLVKEIKTESDLELFRLAVTNYAQKVQSEKTPSKFVKMFSTFASEWKDYLDTPNIVIWPHTISACEVLE